MRVPWGDDLNMLGLQTDGREEGRPYPLLQPVETDGLVAHFTDLEAHLLTYIDQADAVLGCIAWLTHPRILQAFADLPYGVNIVVQKEDFLRPDLKASDRWRQELAARYAALKPAVDRMFSGTLLDGMSCCADPTIDAIRCMGNYNRDKQPAFPRMHHKFLLFCRHSLEDYETEEWDDEAKDFMPTTYPVERIRPYAVWTGSFNITLNATASRENALYITLPTIVDAYHQEWAWIEGLSEPLNWTQDWVEPEWRIGT